MGFVYPQVSWGRYAAIPAFCDYSSGRDPPSRVETGGVETGGDEGQREAPRKKNKFEVGQMVNISWGNKLKSQKYVIVKNARI